MKSPAIPPGSPSVYMKRGLATGYFPERTVCAEASTSFTLMALNSLIQISDADISYGILVLGNSVNDRAV